MVVFLKHECSLHSGFSIHAELASDPPNEKHKSLLRGSFFTDDDEDDEEYVNFVVIDEFHEKFGPAVSCFKVSFIVPYVTYTLTSCNFHHADLLCADSINGGDLLLLVRVVSILKVMHLKKQHVIGLGADGVEIFKNGRLCWLQVRRSEFLTTYF